MKTPLVRTAMFHGSAKFHGAPARHGARWLSTRGWCAYTTPALTENLFMGNPSDSAFLLTKEGQQSLVDLHVDGILYCPGL